MTRPIFFLTDFGLTDTYVGVVKAVILGIAPDARIVDLTHDVPPQDIRAGAFSLMTAAPYLPDDSVVLAVVDPGVGTARRPIAMQIGGRTFVGPDNGLFSWVTGEEALTPHPLRGANIGCATGRGPRGRGAPESSGLRGRAALRADVPLPVRGRGGATSTVVLDEPVFWRPTVSATFHGRDLFGPVAAHLARGAALQEVGSPCESSTLRRLPWPPTHLRRGADGQIVEAQGEIVHLDRFGNLIANLGPADLPPNPELTVAGRRIAGLSPHFQAGAGASSGLIALIGSTLLLEIAVPNGSAADVLGVGVGASVVARARA
jgi:S-adenosylmethionine hydrolase